MGCSTGKKGRGRNPAQVQGGNTNSLGRAAPHCCGTSPNRLGATPSPQSLRGSGSSGCLGASCGEKLALDGLPRWPPFRNPFVFPTPNGRFIDPKVLRHVVLRPATSFAQFLDVNYWCHER